MFGVDFVSTVPNLPTGSVCQYRYITGACSMKMPGFVLFRYVLVVMTRFPRKPFKVTGD
jgi:hypothetical protein